MTGDAQSSGITTQAEVLARVRLGPHKVPRIPCGNCGTEHHYDIAHGEYLGHCRECGSYLRRPTEAEHQQFTEFLVWNSEHLNSGGAQS